MNTWRRFLWLLGLVLVACGAGSLPSAAELRAASENPCTDQSTEVRARLRAIALEECGALEGDDVSACEAEVVSKTDALELAVRLYCDTPGLRSEGIRRPTSPCEGCKVVHVAPPPQYGNKVL